MLFLSHLMALLPPMPRFTFLLAVLCLLSAIHPLRAADGLTVFPSAISLDGADDRQQLVVTQVSGEKAADRTATATYTSNSLTIAKVDSNGLVAAVGDGNATLTVVCNGITATVAV